MDEVALSRVRGPASVVSARIAGKCCMLGETKMVGNASHTNLECARWHSWRFEAKWNGISQLPASTGT